MECHDDYVGFAQGYIIMTWKESMFRNVLRERKVFRSCLERRLRFMCQNSIIECLLVLQVLTTVSFCWALTRTEIFRLIRDFEVSFLFFFLFFIIPLDDSHGTCDRSRECLALEPMPMPVPERCRLLR